MVFWLQLPFSFFFFSTVSFFISWGHADKFHVKNLQGLFALLMFKEQVCNGNTKSFISQNIFKERFVWSINESSMDNFNQNLISGIMLYFKGRNLKRKISLSPAYKSVYNLLNFSSGLDVLNFLIANKIIRKQAYSDSVPSEIPSGHLGIRRTARLVTL